ncbi:MAG: branched-chain amino acid ABC transporter permease [Clostridia bacterium]|nr:branched-chain amino acid ABC transporter permease [Clostridia bacterium]
MFVDVETIIKLASLITALGILIGVFCKVHKWYLKQEQQDAEIERLKEENCLLCYGMSAALDGLIQLGANHDVPEAKKKLDKYLNKEAHH